MNDQLFNDIVAWAVRILTAALILGVGVWFAFFISKFVQREANKHPRIDATLAAFLALLLRYAILAFVLIAVLQKFGVQTTSLVAVLGAGALAVGLALQGTLGNVASGIMIALLRPYKLGDFVEINGKEGRVADIDLFFTELATQEGRKIFVPNGQVVTNPIVNHSRHGQRRCVLAFGIGYEDDIDQALDIMRDVMAGDPRAMAEPEPWFGVESLGDFSVSVSGRVWVKTPDHFQYKADMLKLVKEAFDREGVELPYPHSVEISKGEITLRTPPIKPPPARETGADHSERRGA